MEAGKRGRFPLAIDQSVISRSQHLIARDLENKFINKLSSLVSNTRAIIQNRLHYHDDVLPVISCFTTIFNTSQKDKQEALTKYTETALNSLQDLRRELDQMEILINETVELLGKFPTNLLASQEVKDIWNS